MRNAALELRQYLGAQAQVFLCEFALHRYRARRPHAPVRTQGVYALGLFAAHQKIHHSPFALQQLLHQALANKAAGTGHKIKHAVLSMEKGLEGQAYTKDHSLTKVSFVHGFVFDNGV